MRWWRPGLFLALVLAACGGSGDGAGPPGTTSMLATMATTVAPATTATPATTVATTTNPLSTEAATTAEAATTTEPLTATEPAVRQDRHYSIGQSVEGRPISVHERGSGDTVVLVVGVMHGNETAGVQVVRDLATMPLPDGVHLYLVESMNPDGQAHDIRTNANLVDLNRNFPHNWAPLGEPGDWQYAGTGPGSEPETQAIVAFINQIRPELAVWYHQDLYRLSPASGRKGELVQRYSELTGLPIVSITGGTYTGTATPWEEQAVSGSAAFIVELGPTLSDAEAAMHAAAVLDIATYR